MEPKEAQHDAVHSKETYASDRPLLPLNVRDGAQEKRASNLAFLDGLRGIAALAVYLHHHMTEFYGIECDLMHPYGYQGRYHFGQWRFIRVFFAGGTPAVMVFFVLSGYVLSRGVMKMLENGTSTPTIHKYLLTATLRRPIRLWLPAILVSLPVAILFHTPLKPIGVFVMIQTNIFKELWSYVVNLIETLNPLIAHGPFQQAFQYDPPVWTMGYELNGSVVVYAVMAACGPFLSTRHRMIAFAILVFVTFEYGHYSLPPFILGMILAQTDVASLDKSYIDRVPEKRRDWVFNAIFLVGWWLLSDPGPLVKPTTTWYGLPAAWIPFFYFHNPNFATNTIGAFLVVYASLRLSWLQKFLTRATWLGRVSFALYLTHVPVMWFFAIRTRRFFGAPVGETEGKAFFDGMLPVPDIGPQGLSTRYLAMQLVILPLNLAIAELATTWVDETSVTASKRFAAKVMQRLHL